MLDLPLNLRLERMPELYAPYVGHITDNVVLLNDGSYMVMVRLHGLPYELVAPLVRKNRALAVNDLLRRLPVDTLTIHLVKHEIAGTQSPPECSTVYGRNMMHRYRDVVLGNDVRAISWFMALIVRPATPGFLRRASHEIDSDLMERLEYSAQTLMGTLSDHAPKLLGRHDVATDLPDETITMSEIGSALYLIRTGIEQEIPETAGTLGSAVLPVSPEFGKREFDLCIPGQPRYGAMVSLKDYPSRTRAGMFNELMDGNFSFSLSQGFSYEGTRLNEAKLALRDIHMGHTGSRTETLAAGLKKMADDASSNRSTTGMHNFALAVFAPRLEDLGRHVGKVMTALTRYGGAVPIKERNSWWNGAMEGQYWSLLPGVVWTHSRSGQISTLNLAHMASLEGFSTGAARGYWGRAPIRFRTRAGTAFDYIPTVDDVGHTLICGIVGSGKTVGLSFVKTAMDAVLGASGLRLLIDKDGSNRLSIEMEGGSYATFRRGEASGVAPLKAFDDTPRNRAFFHGLYSWLIMRDGKGNIAPDDEHRMARGIARQLKMPKRLRSMGGVREFMGYSDPVNGAGARFEKWCAGGPMGWLLDGDVHIIDLDPTNARLYGFDFTALLPKEGEHDDGACQAAAAVISHQLRDYIDGRRIMFICEEARFYLEPLARLIDDLTLTGRKSEVMVALVAQQPEHFIESPIGLSLMSQCRTKILFPNRAADRDTYVNRVGISPKAFEQLSHGMFVGNAARRFLLWRGEGESAICEFDLSGMPDEVAIMSARARTNRLLDQIKSEINRPLTPTDLRREFLRRNTRHMEQENA